MAPTVKKWKVDKLTAVGGLDSFDKYLNSLERDKWDIYKIHFTKTDSGYDQMIVVSTQDYIQKGIF
jgi:predicted aldo/keto reductase-like oxidoreductase